MTTSTWKLIATVSALSVLTCAGAAYPAATNHLDEILARGSVRVGTTGDYRPFSYRDRASGAYQGSDVELAGQLAQALGVKLELVATSWPTLMTDLAGDKFDIAMSGVSVNLERQKYAVFSLPYLRDGKTPITRCENKERFQTMAQIDRPTVRLVVNPGGTNERFARAHFPRAQLIVHADNVTIFDEIVSGRADLMVTDAIEARLQQTLRAPLCALHPQAPFDVSEKAYLLPPDWRWKNWVDQWLHQTIDSGAYARTQDKWLNWPWEQARAPAGLEQLLTLMHERLMLMPDVARSKWNSGTAIEDVPRENAIIDALAAQAGQAGVPLAWAKAFFRAQIEAAKNVQSALFERWRQEKAGQFAGVPDLKGDLRPRLDALTPKLLKALTDSWGLLHNAAGQQAVRAQVERQLGAAGKAGAMAAAPLSDGSASRAMAD